MTSSNAWPQNYVPTPQEWNNRTIVTAANAGDLDPTPAVGQMEWQTDVATLWLCTSASPVTRVAINPAALVTAKGDLLAATAAGTLARFAVSVTDGQALLADSTQASGLRWGSAGNGDSDQVVIGVQVFS